MSACTVFLKSATDVCFEMYGSSMNAIILNIVFVQLDIDLQRRTIVLISVS